ncbi:threonine--tRNA ligase, mitochondrial [[Candida] jaroonii]|uniref:Threonine--tRNA ligase, mitochondrial n=1 Tax=[Candida] jaroonii TaxID=467808 RepID=A0ACA9Y092_9ASCO|nr:threonine--tRNA ligase, mitochondrial [[Candida] jaroonii]
MRSKILRLVRFQHVSSTQSNQLIANKQLLYTTHELSPGSIFFLPHGTRVFNKLIQFMKNQQIKYGFQEVITPLIYKNKLWEQSGHWENYKDDMFKVVGNDLAREEVEEGHEHGHEHEYGLKPMNCPGHCIIFSKFERSYNELPVRLSDFSSLHRNEASGALSGLTRVRRFHQDDGHIFCEMNQIKDEILNTINLIRDTYKIFDIDQHIQFTLSTRPENFIGEIESWNVAEEELKKVLQETCGDNWSIKDKDGAFYGPKIDIMVTDNYSKTHQIGTIQLDFQLPSRFDLKYIDSEGNRDKKPIMIHRAVFGSLERFFAILLDNYKGNWPFWLNPRQAIIIPVNSSHIEYCEGLKKTLSGDIINNDISPITGYNFYIDIDKRGETVGNRIKEAISKGYSYILMVGDKDIETGTIAIRSRSNRKVENLTVDEIYSKFINLEKQFK